MLCAGVQGRSEQFWNHVRHHVRHHEGRHEGRHHPHTGQSVICSDPSREVVRDQWLDYVTEQDIHPSYTLLDPLLTHIQSELSRSPNSTNVMPYPSESGSTGGDMECPTLINGLRNSTEVEDRSLCPVYYNIDYDAERYPNELVVAECRCIERCVGLLAESGAGCEKIYYNVPVLRKTPACDGDGRYIYTHSWHRLAVSCTCAVSRQT